MITVMPIQWPLNVGVSAETVPGMIAFWSVCWTGDSRLRRLLSGSVYDWMTVQSENRSGPDYRTFNSAFIPCYCGSYGYLTHQDNNTGCPRSPKSAFPKG